MARAARTPTPEAAPDAAALRPVRLHALTPAEQIAKHLGQGILMGEYKAGERIGEQAVADLFGCSRGPVRDALKLLDKQGLVELSPRRGAFVVEFVLDDVADSFTLRGALLSLAVRCLAANPDKAALDTLEQRLDELRELTRSESAPLVDFVKAVGRMGTGLVQASEHRQLIQAYRNLPHDAVWQMLWVHGPPLDYDRPRRRRDSLRLYEKVLAAIRAGDADAAETHMRRIMMDSCHEVMAHLRATRGGAVAPYRLKLLG